MKNIITAKNTIIVLGVIFVVWAIVSFTLPEKQNLRGIVSGYNVFSGGVIATSTEIATTTTADCCNLLLVRSATRQWVKIENIEAGNPITIQLSESTSTLAYGTGIVLDQWDIFEINPDNLYIGDIQVIASSSTNTVSIMYKQ